MTYPFTAEELAEGLAFRCEVCRQPIGEACVSAVIPGGPCTFGMHMGRMERSARKVERPC